MKRILVVFSFAFLLLAGCENLNTDLPKTDTSKYINDNKVTFPRGTRAIDIYNTVASLPTFSDNEYHDVTGEWKYIKTDKDKDGLTTQTWQSVLFTKIKHTHSKRDNEVNTLIQSIYIPTKQA
jgi:hypothetical protein